MKKHVLISVALCTALSVFAMTESAEAGLRFNGLRLNGTEFNGLRLNGLRLNGLRMNGLRFNGLRFNGLRLNGMHLEGVTVQETGSLRAEAGQLVLMVRPEAN